MTIQVSIVPSPLDIEQLGINKIPAKIDLKAFWTWGGGSVWLLASICCQGPMEIWEQ